MNLETKITDVDSLSQLVIDLDILSNPFVLLSPQINTVKIEYLFSEDIWAVNSHFFIWNVFLFVSS